LYTVLYEPAESKAETKQYDVELGDKSDIGSGRRSPRPMALWIRYCPSSSGNSMETGKISALACNIRLYTNLKISWYAIGYG
jgi:hypothetical protein